MSMAKARAQSVPGLICAHMSALAARGVNNGSITISFAPLSFASKICPIISPLSAVPKGYIPIRSYNLCFHNLDAF
jgi:hypothetical protein